MKVQLFASVSAMLLCTIPGVVLSTEEQPNLRGVTLATAFEDQLADLMTGDKDIKKEVKKVVDKKGGNAKKVIKKLEDKGYDKKEVKKLVNKAVKKYEEKRDYYRKDRKSCSEHYKEEDCRGYRGCGGYRCCAWEAGKCHTIRSFEDEDFSLDSSEVLFDSEEYDMDLYEDEDSEDYDFYENKEESFTTTTLRIPPPPAKKYCFQWHNNEGCREGGRTDAGRCARNWTKKCIYCEMDSEEANHLTGECVPRLGFGGSDVRVKRCFRWHKDVGCRRGSEASHCRRNWTKKCIYCERDVKANKITGKCKRKGMFLEEA